MSKYEVKDEKGINIDIDLVILRYGNLWESTFDRLDEKHDGYIFTFYHKGQKHHIYRKINA